MDDHVDPSSAEQSRQPRPHRASESQPTSRAGLVGGVVIAVVVAILVGARLTGFPQITPVTQLVAFYQLLAVPLLLILVVAILRRSGIVVVVALASVVAIVGTWLPVLAVTSVEPTGPTYRVVSANVYVGQGTQPLIDRLAADPTPTDILLLAECTPECAAVLDQSAMKAMFPYRHVDALPGARGAAILSRQPITDATPISADASQLPNGLAMPSARTRLGAIELTVKVAHPYPPIPLELGQWAADLDYLADFARTADGPLLIGGDFNATIYHQQFRNILGDTLVDGTSNAAGTWPSSFPPPMAAPIDHILFSTPFERVASGTWDIPDTDHRAVWADIAATSRLE